MSDKERQELFQGYGLTCMDCAKTCLVSGVLYCDVLHDIVDRKDLACAKFEPRRKYGSK